MAWWNEVSRRVQVRDQRSVTPGAGPSAEPHREPHFPRIPLPGASSGPWRPNAPSVSEPSIGGRAWAHGTPGYGCPRLRGCRHRLSDPRVRYRWTTADRRPPLAGAGGPAPQPRRPGHTMSHRRYSPRSAVPARRGDLMAGAEEGDGGDREAGRKACLSVLVLPPWSCRAAGGVGARAPDPGTGAGRRPRVPGSSARRRSGGGGGGRPDRMPHHARRAAAPRRPEPGGTSHPDIGRP
jgi:hypothetical protein